MGVNDFFIKQETSRVVSTFVNMYIREGVKDIIDEGKTNEDIAENVMKNVLDNLLKEDGAQGLYYFVNNADRISEKIDDELELDNNKEVIDYSKFSLFITENNKQVLNPIYEDILKKAPKKAIDDIKKDIIKNFDPKSTEKYTENKILYETFKDIIGVEKGKTFLSRAAEKNKSIFEVLKEIIIEWFTTPTEKKFENEGNKFLKQSVKNKIVPVAPFEEDCTIIEDTNNTFGVSMVEQKVNAGEELIQFDNENLIEPNFDQSYNKKESGIEPNFDQTFNNEECTINEEINSIEKQ